LIKPFFSKYFELAFWVVSLTALALTDPIAQPHFALCPLKWLGFAWCPGCGLGHSISWLFHGNIEASFHAHWLGIPAVLVILHRIYSLGKRRLIFDKYFPVPEYHMPNN